MAIEVIDEFKKLLFLTTSKLLVRKKGTKVYYQLTGEELLEAVQLCGTQLTSKQVEKMKRKKRRYNIRGD